MFPYKSKLAPRGERVEEMATGVFRERKRVASRTHSKKKKAESLSALASGAPVLQQRGAAPAG